ncbi:hypothetical protein FHT78_004541 [Rhizobium sp. BK196]|nr:hypothetical protein [Rhizobium sp. BK196]MBB3312758.1 hypothetical protein [Rhizobium sp. BK196]
MDFTEVRLDQQVAMLFRFPSLGVHMKITSGLILLLVLSWSPASAKEDMKFRTLMESKQTSVVEMLIGAAGLTLLFVNDELKDAGQPPLYCPPQNRAISNTEYVAVVKKYLELHPDIGEETFQVYPYVLLTSLKHMYPC